MEETRGSSRPDPQADLLNAALKKGDNYNTSVKIGGKYYFVIALEGGDVARIKEHNSQKLQTLANSFFKAHK